MGFGSVWGCRCCCLLPDTAGSLITAPHLGAAYRGLPSCHCLPVIPICVSILLVWDGSSVQATHEGSTGVGAAGMQGCTRPAASCRLCFGSLIYKCFQIHCCGLGVGLWKVRSCGAFRSSCFFPMDIVHHRGAELVPVSWCCPFLPGCAYD